MRYAIPYGSSSAVRKSIPYPHRLGEYAERLAATLNWTGPMMVELRHDPETDTAYLLEINGRFLGSLRLAIDAGADVPYAYYQMLRGRSLPAAARAPVGRRRPRAVVAVDGY